ncbi:MAG: methionine--tRNA ligase [Thermoplasmataceae archaeon]
MLVNCALPYSNGSLHLGQIAGAYLGADIFVRFNRMVGNDVLFICGSDEHGTPITIAADKAGISPKEIADRYNREHINTFKSLGIDFDYFGRTSLPEHQDTVNEFIGAFQERGFLSSGNMISPFCPSCNRFMPDRYIEGTCPYCGYEGARGDQCDNCGKTLDPQDLINPRCVVCDGTPEFRETQHLFFRLSLFSDQLLRWIDSRKWWRDNVIRFSRNFISAGLKDRPITRDIEWGVRVNIPGYEHKRIYVWFEALIGYITFARIYSNMIGKPSYWEEFYKNPEARTYYFIGKDNIPFHTIIWPAMLMAKGDIQLPYDVPANEYLTFRGQKFSKSRKIGVTADEVLRVVPKDYVRFFLAYNLPEQSDADFNTDEMEDRINTELIGKFGNYVNRVAAFAGRNFGRVRMPDSASMDEDDAGAISEIEKTLRIYRENLSNVLVKRALFVWLELVKYSNQYFNRSAPWSLIKNNRKKCEAKIYLALHLARALTIMAYPYIPESSLRIMKALGLPDADGSITLDEAAKMIPEYVLAEITSPPFTPLDLEGENPNGLDLRVGTIVEVEDHPNADRLLLMKVSLGFRIAQIVAGLKAYYNKSDLLGKRVILINNMKWSKIRGSESQGMLLAAADENERVELLTGNWDSIKDGEAVYIGDYPYNQKGKVEKDDIASYNLRVGSINGGKVVTATIGGEVLTLSIGGKPITFSLSVEDGSTVR